MASPEWFRRRESWLEQYKTAHGGQDPACAVCGAAWTLRGGDLHHRTYSRLGAEAWQDLVAMCRKCHGELHALLEQNPAWRRIPRQQATDIIVERMRARVWGHPDNEGE